MVEAESIEVVPDDADDPDAATDADATGEE